MHDRDHDDHDNVHDRDEDAHDRDEDAHDRDKDVHNDVHDCDEDDHDEDAHDRDEDVHNDVHDCDEDDRDDVHDRANAMRTSVMTTTTMTMCDRGAAAARVGEGGEGGVISTTDVYIILF